jgi:hypothetical protein
METNNIMKTFRAPSSGVKDKISISFSGGKTSAYMTKMVLDYFKEHEPSKQILVIFANTGQEHEETLKFIHKCDQEFGFNTIWIEADVSSEMGVGTNYKVVTYETASRDGKPYADVIAKYGIPNQKYNHCTRETKLNPMTAYYRSIGWKPKTYSVAVGIRADEMQRLSPKSMEAGVWYPCIDAGVTKEDVRGWWADQSFNLMIPEHLGNCTWCWKKSNRKLLTIARSNPEMFDFPARMEVQHGLSGYKGAGYEGVKRTFFRGNRTAQDIIEESKGRFEPFVDWKFIPYDEDMDEHGSCGDSCEVGADKNDLYGGYDLFDLIEKKQGNE